jgi:glycosyltransferase involved in cell wall biosynthesis
MADRLRILQLVNVRWWNASAEYGVHLALGLLRRGHDVIVAGQADSPPMRRAREMGLATHATRMLERHPGRLCDSLRDLISLIRREAIEVVNAHRAEGHLWAALARLCLSRRIVLVRTRGDVRPPQGHLFDELLHARLTDAVVLPARALQQLVLERLPRCAEKLTVIPPGVDLPDPDRIVTPAQGRRALGWPEGDPVVGIVGRLSPVKGHGIFLQAARLVLSRFPRVRFVIVGGEAQLKTSDIKALADELGISDRIWCSGYVAEVAPIVAACDVTVVASLGSEVICRVALEHMAMARPVVGTRINAIPEVVEHGTTGLLVPPGDPQAMAEAIISLLENAHLASAMGGAGRRRVEEAFTLEHQAQRTEALYRQLLRVKQLQRR